MFPFLSSFFFRKKRRGGDTCIFVLIRALAVSANAAAAETIGFPCDSDELRRNKGGQFFFLFYFFRKL